VTEGRGQDRALGNASKGPDSDSDSDSPRELKVVYATRQSHPLGELVCERDDSQGIRSIASCGP
jgi:hypothetical protein